MVFSKAFLATTEKKFDEDLTFSIENKCIYIFITIISIIYIYLLFVVFFHAPVLFFYLVNCACATRVIVDDGEYVSLDRWAVNVMQMRYARGLLLNCRPCLTKRSCSKVLN